MVENHMAAFSSSAGALVLSRKFRYLVHQHSLQSMWVTEFPFSYFFLCLSKPEWDLIACNLHDKCLFSVTLFSNSVCYSAGHKEMLWVQKAKKRVNLPFYLSLKCHSYIRIQVYFSLTAHRATHMQPTHLSGMRATRPRNLSEAKGIFTAVELYHSVLMNTWHEFMKTQRTEWTPV